MWNSGPLCRITAPGFDASSCCGSRPETSSRLCRFAITERLARTAALGSPVVPAVKTMTAGSFSSAPPCGAGSADPDSDQSRTSPTSITPGIAGNSSRRFSSATTTDGSTSAAAWSASPRFHHPLPSVTTAPARTPAQKPITHSGELGARRSSRSPGFRPAPVNRPATRSAAVNTSPNVRRRPPCTRWTRARQRLASSMSSATWRRRGEY